MLKRPLFLAALLLTAFLWIRLTAGEAGDSPPKNAVGRELRTGTLLHVTGQVCQKEENKIWLQSVTIVFADDSFHHTGISEQKIPYDQKLICEILGEAELPLGCRVAVRGTFAAFSEASNPGEFDSACYYRSLRAGGRISAAELMGRGDGSWPVREAAWKLRQYLRGRLYQILPQEDAGVMCALLLGDRTELDSEIKDLYKRNGILHILSISSLHVTIIGMSIYKGLRKAGLPIIPAALAGSAVLLFYGAVTGFTVSVCRAVGMFLIRMGAEILGRSYDTLTALGILMAAMALYNPCYLQNAGFLLSFSSVLGIVVFLPVWEAGVSGNSGILYYGEKKWRVRLRKGAGKLRAAAAASLSITLTTLPIQLWFYYEAPVYSAAVNLLILPLMKPLLVTGFLSLIPGLGFVSEIDRTILRGYETMCGFCDRLPFHTWNPGRPALWQVFLYYGILLSVVWMKCRADTAGKKTGSRRRMKKGDTSGRTGDREPAEKRRAGVLRCAIVVFATVLLGIRLPGGNQVIFLDVGQGDCCLVRTASGENYLFDCGSSSRSGVGKYVLLPCLKYYGIHTLDGVFVSHSDTDHTNGVTELLELAEVNRLRIRQLILPAVEKGQRESQFASLLTAAEGTELSGGGKGGGVRTAWLSAGETWKCEAAEFYCLHPEKGWPADNTNASSQCVYVNFGGFSLLLTGDVEGRGEEALIEELRKRMIGKITVLKVAHHGSGNSTAAELLKQITPRLAVISCGKNNRYGHPHEELLRRLEDVGCAILQTSERGAVIVKEGRNGLEIRGFRRRAP